MQHTPAKFNLKKSLPFIGLVVLVIGLVVTTLAVRNNQESRQFAAYPISYPLPTSPVYTTPQPIPARCWNQVLIRENGNMYWSNGCRGSIDQANQFCTQSLVALNMDEINWHSAWLQSDQSVPSSCTNYNTEPIPTSTSRPTPIPQNPTPTIDTSRYSIRILPEPDATGIYRVAAFGSRTTFEVQIDGPGGGNIPLPSDMRIEWRTNNVGILNLTAFPGTKTLSSVSNNFGYTLLTARLVNIFNSQEFAQANLMVKSGEYSSQANAATPQCTVTMYRDEATNRPPSYNLIQPITSVTPGQVVVITAGFTNKANKQYENVSNHITLGKYLQFVDTNGANCQLDKNANAIVCQHGVFLSGGGSSMAFRVKYVGSTAVPVSVFATTFANNGDTGSCSTEANSISTL